MKNDLVTKILAVSKNLGMSHIGSNLSCLSVLEEIYKIKKPEDIVILDNGHAHLSHLIVSGKTVDEATNLIKKYGIHCDRKADCHASGGSLGHGLGIGIGYALTTSANVYVIVSDGSMMEGSNWEALRLISDLPVDNLFIYTNFNGYSAVSEVNYYQLKTRMQQMCGKKIEFRQTDNTIEFAGVDGHYKKI